MRRRLAPLLPFIAVASLGMTFPACTEEIIIQRRADAGAPAGGDGGANAIDRPATNVQTTSIGAVTAGQDYTLDIPKGAIGFNLTIDVDDPDNNFDPDHPPGIQTIKDPKGNIVHDNFTPKGGTNPTSIAAFDSIAAVSVPQSESTPQDISGKWTFRIGEHDKPTSTLKAAAKVQIQSSGDGVYHGGKIDLHVHVVEGLEIDGKTVTGATAQASPEIAKRVDGFYKAMKQLLDIDRGTTVFHPEGAALKNITTINSLLQGFAVADGKDGSQEFHVLFNNVIKIQDVPEAQGIAPGIPGAANTYGRSVSNIIIAISPSVDLDVLTMVHEMGHFIGLNHTTELDASSADPLSDTPRCTTILDKNYGSCPDQPNVMFAAGGIPDGALTLSPTQKRVYRGSPVYKAFTSGSATQSNENDAPFKLTPSFRISKRPLAPVESDLSAGFCGLVRIDAKKLAAQYGEAELLRVANDPDLVPVVRSRARFALDDLHKSK